MAPLPAPISSTSPTGCTPCSAQGNTMRRATNRHGALRQNADSNRDIVGMTPPPLPGSGPSDSSASYDIVSSIARRPARPSRTRGLRSPPHRESVDYPDVSRSPIWLDQTEQDATRRCRAGIGGPALRWGGPDGRLRLRAVVPGRGELGDLHHLRRELLPPEDPTGLEGHGRLLLVRGRVDGRDVRVPAHHLPAVRVGGEPLRGPHPDP